MGKTKAHIGSHQGFNIELPSCGWIDLGKLSIRWTMNYQEEVKVQVSINGVGGRVIYDGPV